MWCSYALLASSAIMYTDRGCSVIEWVATRRPWIDACAFGATYGRSFIVHEDRSDTPATIAYCGASRCQPIGAPGAYWLISAIANASGSTLDHAATLARSGIRNSGIGGVEARPLSYDRPKNATRRRATTPRISKLENSTPAMAAASDASSSRAMKSS